MAKEAQDTGSRRWNPWRIAAWSFAAFILLLPLVAMRFTGEVNWTRSDFVSAAVLIGGVGAVFELTVRMSRDYAYRAAVGFALAATFLTIWVNGAVGMIGSEGNPYNLLFGGVLLIALVGAIAARFRPSGMKRAMVAAAIAQLAVAAFGLSADMLGALLSMAFAAPWLLAAAMFHKAAREQVPAGAVL